jgi:fatty acid desaturase
MASIVIIPLTQWIPHSGNFVKKNINESRFMVAQNYNLPLAVGRQHLTHHLYPTVQVTRLSKFTKSINWLIDKKIRESNAVG